MSNNCFTHDTDARNDSKIVRLRMRHGAAGYGVYFMILERLREESGCMSAKDYNMIAFDLRVDAALVKAVIEDFGLFAFTDDGECFYSESLDRRTSMEEEERGKRDSLRKKRSAAGRMSGKMRKERKRATAGAEQKSNKNRTLFEHCSEQCSEQNLNSVPNKTATKTATQFADNERITTGFEILSDTGEYATGIIQKENEQEKKENEQEKEIPLFPHTPLSPKEKEKEKEKTHTVPACAYTCEGVTPSALKAGGPCGAVPTKPPPSPPAQAAPQFRPPSLEEVRAYIDGNGYGDVDAYRFWNFYECKGWMVGRNKMKNWHAAVATWRRLTNNTDHAADNHTGSRPCVDAHNESDADFKARIIRQISRREDISEDLPY